LEADYGPKYPFAKNWGPPVSYAGDVLVKIFPTIPSQNLLVRFFQFWHMVCSLLPAPLLPATNPDKCSAVAEMGDRLATIDMGRKEGGLLYSFRGSWVPI